jgi:DNA-damage-inducible protein J
MRLNFGVRHYPDSPVALHVGVHYICSTKCTRTYSGGLKMAKTKTVTVRLEPELKENVEDILGELGLTTSQAIVLFYKQVQLHQGLPFEVRIPNEVTREALADAEKRRGLTSYESSDALFADLGI